MYVILQVYFCNSLLSNKHADDLLLVVFEQAKISPLQSVKSNRNRLIQWAETKSALRSYCFLKKSELEEKAKRRRIKYKRSESVDALRQKLAMYDSRSDPDEQETEFDNSAVDPITKQIVEWSFLQPESNKGKHDARFIVVSSQQMDPKAE